LLYFYFLLLQAINELVLSTFGRAANVNHVDVQFPWYLETIHFCSSCLGNLKICCSYVWTWKSLFEGIWDSYDILLVVNICLGTHTLRYGKSYWQMMNTVVFNSLQCVGHYFS